MLRVQIDAAHQSALKLNFPISTRLAQNPKTMIYWAFFIVLIAKPLDKASAREAFPVLHCTIAKVAHSCAATQEKARQSNCIVSDFSFT
jgi:hypothetical protein